MPLPHGCRFACLLKSARRSGSAGRCRVCRRMARRVSRPRRIPHDRRMRGDLERDQSTRSAAMGRACGDGAGVCDLPADSCASGWHLCDASGTASELHVLSLLAASERRQRNVHFGYLALRFAEGLRLVLRVGVLRFAVRIFLHRACGHGRRVIDPVPGARGCESAGGWLLPRSSLPRRTSASRHAFPRRL
jgi:hypothetical protein